MLQVTDVRVVYPNGTEALKSISLTANKGEIVAVVGRSGAGKSTLLRCINGLQRPAAGKIVLDGEEITALNAQQIRLARRQIGFVWQEYNLVERLSALQNVLTGRLGYNRRLLSLIGYFGKADREIAVHNLERVNMLHRAGQRADKLSGGEKQRISIARAMSQQPKIILADEPVASLDPNLAWQILNDLARLAREDGVTTIVNLHQVELAKEFADHIVGIGRGVVIFDGSPAQLDQDTLNDIYRSDPRDAQANRRVNAAVA
jgi:phosphonate transport system ATP-binding protein